MAAPVVIVAKKAIKVAIRIAIRKVIEFVTDPEESVSKIVLFIIGICSIFFILIILLCGTTSAVNGYVVNKAEAFFESDLYKEIEKADRRFISKERSDLISYLLSSLPEENTESEEADPSEDYSEISERPSESAEEILARYHITVILYEKFQEQNIEKRETEQVSEKIGVESEKIVVKKETGAAKLISVFSNGIVLTGKIIIMLIIGSLVSFALTVLLNSQLRNAVFEIMKNWKMF